jgi:hypothetical protein
MGAGRSGGRRRKRRRDVIDLQVFVDALNAILRGQLSGYLADDQLAGLLWGAVIYLNGRLPAQLWFSFGNKSGNTVVAASTLSPGVAPESPWGSVILAAAKWTLASSGALARGEDNVGSYAQASHSVSTASRAAQHRLNAAECKDDLERLITVALGMTTHGQQDVDFSQASY